MFKNISLYFILCVCGLFVSQFAYAANNIVNRSYYYAQVGVGADAFSRLFVSLKSYDDQKKIWETNNYTLHGYGDINPYISFGFYINSAQLALEAEYGVHTVYEKTINGEDVHNEDRERAYAVMNYFFINGRKNLFTLFSNNNIIFVKAGLGASMVNNITLNKSSSMNVPTPAMQLGVGFIRQMSNHLDLDLEYRYKTNFSKRTKVSSGIKQIYSLQAHTIIIAARYKI